MAWQDQMSELARDRGPALVAYAYLLTGDLHTAQDVVQDALVRTFSRRRSGVEVEWLESYVRRAILNEFRDRLRRRRTWAVGRSMVPVAPSAPDTIAAARVDVHAALARLSPRERACIVLRHFEDLSVPEIAASLGLSEGAVKRYLSDARGRLRDVLGESAEHPAHIETTSIERTGR